MNVKNAKNVLIIDNIKSDNIEQVIFILKKGDASPLSKDIIDEANDIIHKYVRRLEAGGYREVKHKKKWFFKKDG